MNSIIQMSSAEKHNENDNTIIYDKNMKKNNEWSEISNISTFYMIIMIIIAIVTFFISFIFLDLIDQVFCSMLYIILIILIELINLMISIIMTIWSLFLMPFIAGAITFIIIISIDILISNNSKNKTIQYLRVFKKFINEKDKDIELIFKAIKNPFNNEESKNKHDDSTDGSINECFA